jgi:hypothetical protein
MELERQQLRIPFCQKFWIVSTNHYLLKFRTMSDKEVKEFSEKLRSGLEIAEKRMLEEKALRGEDIIVSSDGKTIERIPARQLLYSEG